MSAERSTGGDEGDPRYRPLLIDWNSTAGMAALLVAVLFANMVWDQRGPASWGRLVFVLVFSPFIAAVFELYWEARKRSREYSRWKRTKSEPRPRVDN